MVIKPDGQCGTKKNNNPLCCGHTILFGAFFFSYRQQCVFQSDTHKLVKVDLQDYIYVRYAVVRSTAIIVIMPLRYVPLKTQHTKRAWNINGETNQWKKKKKLSQLIPHTHSQRLPTQNA